MGAPQVIMIGLLGLSVGVNAAKHDEPRTGKYNVVTTMVAVTLEAALLYWGGFFG